MRQEPLVSVIIPVYNTERYIRECLESVLAQTYHSIEILVCDDASTDTTPSILQTYAQQYQQIKIWRHQVNQGPGAARHTLIAYAKGKYLAFIDADDCWFPDKIAAQVLLLESKPHVGLVYTLSQQISEQGVIIKPIRECTHLLRTGNVFNDYFLCTFFSIVTVMLRTDLIDRVGSFNPQYRVVEDHDFFLRITGVTEIDYIPRVFVQYRMHTQNVSLDWNNLYSAHMNILDFWRYTSLEPFPYAPQKEYVARLIKKRERILRQRFLENYLLQGDIRDYIKYSILGGWISIYAGIRALIKNVYKKVLKLRNKSSYNISK